MGAGRKFFGEAPANFDASLLHVWCSLTANGSELRNEGPFLAPTVLIEGAQPVWQRLTACEVNAFVQLLLQGGVPIRSRHRVEEEYAKLPFYKVNYTLHGILCFNERSPAPRSGAAKCPEPVPFAA